MPKGREGDTSVTGCPNSPLYVVLSSVQDDVRSNQLDKRGAKCGVVSQTLAKTLFFLFLSIFVMVNPSKEVKSSPPFFRLASLSPASLRNTSGISLE